MAVNFGELIQQILDDTNRDASTLLNGGVATYKTAVGRAIVTAIKYMESSLYWAFKTSSVVTILDTQFSTPLPADFNSMVTVQFNIGNVLYSLREGFTDVTFPNLIAFYNNNAQQGIPNKYSIYDNTLYIFPLASGDTDFTLYYYQKDIFYPVVDSDTSIWFSDETVDLVRMKAMERFYHDTLQSSEIATTYSLAVIDFEKNLMRKNNLRQNFNTLSI
jgi:outer membrane protein assembly factor BamB